jgi:5,10-methylenetetrahydromethanopterin reductase
MTKAKREFWDGTGLNYPLAIPEWVKRLEGDGFDGRNFCDSQNRYADPFVCMGLAAGVTKTLKFSTGATNPVTRHPALMANVIGTVQVATGGRAYLGIARGDSALAHIGKAPAPPEVFERYCKVVQAYLSGNEVPFAEVDAAMGGVRKDLRSAEELHIGKVPTGSKLQWLPGDVPKVPMDVYATGPKIMAIGARHAEQLTFAVGAHPARIRWAMDLAKQVRREAGLDPNGISYGAMVGMGLDDDLDRARKRIAGVVAVSTRFSVMHGKPIGPVDKEDEPIFRSLHDGYDMTRHAVTTSNQAGLLPDWFMDKHAVIGPPAVARDRLIELFELGIERIVLLFNASHHGVQEEINAVYRRFAKEVLPAVKSA